MKPTVDEEYARIPRKDGRICDVNALVRWANAKAEEERIMKNGGGDGDDGGNGDDGGDVGGDECQMTRRAQRDSIDR